MTDTATNFDPIPRLQQIATIIKESDTDIFYAPTIVAYDIECAIKEIERLHRDYSCICGQMRRMMEERDEARLEVCKRVESASCLSDGEPTTTASDYARWCGWDCFKEDGKPCQ